MLLITERSTQMRTSHLTIASEDGAKAGFRAYMASNAPLAEKRREEIRSAGNGAKQFNAYCAFFKKDLDRIAAERRAAEQRDDVQDNIVSADELDSFQGVPESVVRKLARLLGRDTGVQAFEDDEQDDELNEPDNIDEPVTVVEKGVKQVVNRYEAPVATRITWPMCLALFGRAKAFNESVTITGRDGDNAQSYDYHLDIEFDDGSVAEDITPESASELIGEWKESR